MLPKRTLSRVLAPACLLIAALAAPCRAQTRGALLEIGPMEQTSIGFLKGDFQERMGKDLEKRKDDWAKKGYEVVFQQMFQETLAATVPSRKIKYASVDSHDHSRTYSGRVYLPSRASKSDPPTLLPLVIYQHATETRKKFTPYYAKGDETLLGALAAEACDFAVAMPDGDGMGADDSSEMHAYCHGPTAAICLLDMIRAALGNLGDDSIFDDEAYKWDGRVFIVGYSEGGYIAMSAVKEWSTNDAYKDIPLTGAACMAGPFNFAEATRALLKDGAKNYGRPYIPAYFVDAWSFIYPNDIVFKDAVNPKLLGPGSGSGDIASWLDGTLSGDEITPLIQARLTGDKKGGVTARAIVDDTWYKNNLQDRNSVLSRRLEDNNLVGDWAPPFPVLLVSDPKDETVEFSNTQAIHQSWKKKGSGSLDIVKLSLPGVGGPGHVGGAILAIPMAFVWIDAGMPGSVFDLGKNALEKLIEENTPETLLEAYDAAQEMGQGNQDFAALPLSRIDFAPNHGSADYEVSFADRVFVVGKVKFYTLTRTQQYPGQPVVRGTGAYTKLLGQMKGKSDKLTLPTSEPVYLAVYPQKGLVGLTLKFTGGPAAKRDDYTLNIKQVKNKLVLRRGIPTFSIDGKFQTMVTKASYEHIRRSEPFITLP